MIIWQLMRLFTLYLFLLFPFVCVAQLFPNVVDFHGKIDKVVEKKYGKEYASSKKDSGAFKPGRFSGWKFVYLFDEKSKLIKQTAIYANQVQSESVYQRDKKGDGIIVEQEVISYTDLARPGNCIEYENFISGDGFIHKVNYWSVDLRSNTRELFLLEDGAIYRNGKLQSFVRHNVNEKGELDTGEQCILIYDGLGRLIRIERRDIETDLKTVLDYTYNPRGFLDHYSVDFMVGMPMWGKNPKQDIYYKFDRQGNWIRKYWYSGKKRYLEARRFIKYK
jgi:hypothetical protein